MCVGVPMQVVEVGLGSATCRARDGDHEIDTFLVGDVKPGQWVMTFLGAAREVLDRERAELIAKALDGLASAMRGGGTGDAFADLEAAGPALPPHLEAARRAGAKVA